MICPNCGKPLKKKLTHSEKLSETKEHSYGICQYCKEVVHLVVDSFEKFSYGWINSKEPKYRTRISKLNCKKQVLLIDFKTEDLFKICLDFNKKFGNDVGFIISEENSEEAEKIKNVYDIIVLEQNLFPVKPSFLVEKLIVESLPGDLFSCTETILEKFEEWKND